MRLLPGVCSRCRGTVSLKGGNSIVRLQGSTETFEPSRCAHCVPGSPTCTDDPHNGSPPMSLLLLFTFILSINPPLYRGVGSVSVYDDKILSRTPSRCVFLVSVCLRLKSSPQALCSTATMLILEPWCGKASRPIMKC